MQPPTLDEFLRRIGHASPLACDARTLRAVHRAYVLSVPYENLDVQFGRPLTRDPAPAFDKIVRRRRGGWCYEMNGLLAWALEQIGFQVHRLAGAVMREGAGAIGNHLVLIAYVDGEPWLCDAGFGDGLIEAAPLREGAFANGFYQCALSRTPDGWWRYHNDPRGSAPSFDFHEDVNDEALLERCCQFLQNAVTQFWTEYAHITLRGKIFKTVSADAITEETLPDAATYVAALRDRFSLDLPDAARLWPRIEARHQQLGL
jgi:N-hydroxyarylamine O-acetyltransferase